MILACLQIQAIKTLTMAISHTPEAQHLKGHKQSKGLLTVSGSVLMSSGLTAGTMRLRGIKLASRPPTLACSLRTVRPRRLFLGSLQVMIHRLAACHLQAGSYNASPHADAATEPEVLCAALRMIVVCLHTLSYLLELKHPEMEDQNLSSTHRKAHWS